MPRRPSPPSPTAILALSLLLLLPVVDSWGQGSPDADSAQGRAFEIADYYRTRFVGAPAVHPTGEEIAFTVHEYDLPAGESWTSIWRMDADGGSAQRLTTGSHTDGSPVYSPDGRSLLFVSDRDDERSQLFLLPVDGGEARRLTDFPLDLFDPVWSPDGRWIAVTAEVYPDCGADGDCTKQRDEDRSDHPLEAHVADDLLYRHWTSWSDQKVSHILLVDAATGEVVKDLTPGDFPSPVFMLGSGRGYTFSPDSSRLCFVSKRVEDPASSTDADLWVVEVEGEDPTARSLTPEGDGWDGKPLYSPDGRRLAWLSQETPGYESDLYRLRVMDLETGAVRSLTDRSSFDDWIHDFRWTPDGQGIVFEAEVAARTPLHRIDVDSGQIERFHENGVLAGWELTPDGESIVYTRSRIGAPPELFAVPSDGGRARRLSFLNEELEQEVDIRPGEEMRLPGAGDYEVHTWIIKPHDFDPSKRYPVIVNVHGGPQGSWSDRYRGDWQVYPGKGYVVVLPNPTGSSGFGQDFLDAIRCDWGGRVYEDVMEVTEAVADLPWVDPERIGAMGWSYGGYMMMWMQGHTDRFACQAAMMGLYDLRSFHGATEELWFPEHDLCGTPWTSEEYERWSPSNFVPEFSTPALVITGEKDFRVPYTQSLHYFTDLQKMGVPSRLIVFPNSGHWPGWHDMAFYYLAHLDWFHEYLGGEPAPWDLHSYLDGRVFEAEE